MQEIKQKIVTNNEIDLIDVFKKIWSERKLILKITAVFLVLGVIIAFGTPKEYKAETILFVETGNGSSVNGLLQQFGGLAGISLAGNQSKENLNPDIYPQIIQSSPFLIEIMAEKVHFSSQDTSRISVYQYLSTHVKKSIVGLAVSYTFGLPGKIIELFKKKEQPNYNLPNSNSSPLFLTPQQSGIMGSIVSRIKVQTGDVSGTLKISAEMPDPIAAAELTNSVYLILSKYLIEYKIQKVKTDLEFINKQHTEAKHRYIEAQQRLAMYHDANRNIMLASYKIEEDRMQNDFTLTFNIYNSLSQQLEHAKLKVQENTPVLKVMDPVKVPLNKSQPKRIQIIITMIFLGGFAGIAVVFGKILFRNFKTRERFR